MELKIKNKINKIDFLNTINDILFKAGYNGLIIHKRLNTDIENYYTYTNEYEYLEEGENYLVNTIENGYTMYLCKLCIGKIDNLLKVLLNKFASKQQKTIMDINGFITFVSAKHETMQNIIEKNYNRVVSGLLYTTLYGIGFWCIFSDKNDMMQAKELHTFLKDKNIKYYNEYSDAFWVYRFKISNDIDYNNNLLNEFKNKNK